MFTYWLATAILIMVSFALGVIIKNCEHFVLIPIFFGVITILLVVLSLVLVLNYSWFL